jgi:protein-tyrosine phosphatase
MDFIYYLLIVILFILLIMLFGGLLLNLSNKLFKLKDNNNSEDYHKIIENIYIGNIISAQNKDFIKNNNISIIINCSNDIPNYFILDNSIQYYRLPIDDSLETYDINLMSELLPKYVKIIDDAIKENKNILVHCYAGRQRSACLVTAYLLYKYNYNLSDAYKIILEKRPQAFHYGKSYNFNLSLINFQNNILKV